MADQVLSGTRYDSDLFCVLPGWEFRDGWQEFLTKQIGLKIYRDADWNEFWFGVIEIIRETASARPFWAKDRPVSVRVKEATIVAIPNGIPRSEALVKHFSPKAMVAMRRGFEDMLKKEYDRAESENRDVSLWYPETLALVESMKVAERKAMK